MIVAMLHSGSAIYKPVDDARTPIGRRIDSEVEAMIPEVNMKDYIIDDEHHLSPVVTSTTIVLVAVFAVGILYQLVGILV